MPTTDSPQPDAKKPSAEAEAKAALLRFLRSSGRLRRTSAIALELNVAKQLNRADVVTIDRALHLYEIKTKRDTLARLDNQLTAYAKAADYVTVVAATRHINAILSSVPTYVGVLEIVKFTKKPEIREVRPASMSPLWCVNSALDLLPATEIRARILNDASVKLREGLVELARKRSSVEIRSVVRQFLQDRYLKSTRDFSSLVGRRAIRAEHLAALRLWQTPAKELNAAQHSAPGNDQEVYRAIGDSFGPVPDDVRQLLMG